jgi:hypothetical protein
MIKHNIKDWVINPFMFIAGAKALAAGLVLIVISAALGWIGSTHFDGVLDLHTGGMTAPLWVFIAEGLINWICLCIPLYFLGLIFSPSKFRVIDLLGTEALARGPYVVAAIVMLPDANRRVAAYMLKSIQGPVVDGLAAGDMAIFVIAIIVSLIMTVWMVYLMYKAYAVSCNVTGIKAVVSFIIGVLLAEAGSKIIITKILEEVGRRGLPT